MSGTAALLFTLVFGAQEDEIAREALKGHKLPWEGFGTGSTVTYRETLRRPEISDKGELVYKDVSIESTWSLVGERGEPQKLSILGGGRESVFPLKAAPPGWTRGKGERTGEEKIDVGGRSFGCAVTTITLDAGPDTRQVTTIARSADAPVWAVRRRVETFLRGKRNTLEEELLVEIDRKVKIDGAEVVCQVVQVTVENPGGARTVHRDWRSDKVPGRLVRRETRHYQGEKEIPAAFTKKEVVSFRATK